MSRGARRKLILVAVVAGPGVVLRFAGIHLGPEAAALVFGAGVVASAFLLAWAAEAAQVDISGSLAIALLALIAVLPEYAVDLYFAFTAGHRPEFAQYAAANMTGSNRLLIGVGWPLVAFVAIAAWRRHHGRSPSDSPEDAPGRAVVLPEQSRIEVGFLAAASICAFVIPLTRRLAWYDSVVLLTLFAGYLWRIGREERGEPDLIGVAAEVGGLPRRPRRATITALFVAAAVIVVSAAEPFANGLVGTGAALGIDKFLLVQWLAPLASEAPELIVATLFALRLRGDDALGTLLSSKVNQWTLLVGSLPLAYLLGGGGGALHLDARQTEEFLLTGAQAVLGIAVLAELSMSRSEAVALFALFALQFPFPSKGVRLGFSAVYLAMAAGILVVRRRQLPPTLRAMVRLIPEQVVEARPPPDP
jgi:cation:H+ antiporter